MGVIVKIVEDHDVERFKNKTESELNKLRADGIATDVRFSTSSDGVGNTVYTVMIVGST